MGILMWIAMGLFAGVLAKWIMPGKDPGGIVVTMLIGIGGAIVGGMIGTTLGFGSVTGFDVRSLVIATGGAVALLYGYRVFAPRLWASSRKV
jgi:uncharacterized membrane protein YeaQ/YmgE (transglycosylase-associated protein family)